VVFTGAANGGIAPYSFAWTFGDGATSALQSPTHTFAGAGTYKPSLTVTDSTGASVTVAAGQVTVNGPLAAAASAAPISGDAPVAVVFAGSASGGLGPFTYGWSFGDTTSAAGQNPTHTYSAAGVYNPTLTVTDSRGITATATATVTVAPSLSASAAATPGSGMAPLAVAFAGTPGGGKGPFTYAWDFGDGSKSTTQNPSHSYGGPGTYKVALSVSDANAGTAAAASITVTVAPAPLAVSAVATPTVGDAPFATTVTASASGGWAPYTYAWTLGDGATSTQANPNHTFASAGSYTATLTVTDSKGQTAQATAKVTVYTALSVSSTLTPAAGGAPLQVSVTASAAGGLPPYQFTWAFDDGTTAQGPSATHSYQAGVFHPTLTVHDSAGGTWTGVVATVTSTAPQAPAGAGTGGGGTTGGGTPAPTAAPSTPPSAAPAQTPPAVVATPEQSRPAPDSSPGGPGVLVLTLIGSAIAGLGGALYLGWRRFRLGRRM
jgi:PKD repeat protein